MKRIIPFSKYFLPAVIFSVVVIAVGISGYFVKGGFNLGVDFKAGLIQEIQIAPSAFSMTYNGNGNAAVSFSRTGIDIVITGADITGQDHRFDYSAYPSLKALTDALAQQVTNLTVNTIADDSIQSTWFVYSAQANPQLNNNLYTVHYLPPDSTPVDISEVREAVEHLGSASVQVLGAPQDRHFMIRMDDNDEDQRIDPEKIFSSLETGFGEGNVIVTRADYVGSRFSKQLSDQAGLLLSLTLLLILIYASIRFKPQFAIGAVLAIMHDAFIMVSFIAWTRMEFNTTTIAAILTILGYSINDTIVIFDRVRETRKIFPDYTFVQVLNKAITETLGRTIITTLTTMLAVLSLYIFTTGSMKDFALALLVGMVSGVYSTIFIASGWTHFWEKYIKKSTKKKQKQAAVPAV
ncbi:protein-export membrane protein SecF [Spirochaetia bacterium]|nr:protein-export membrane protein SecF [Spirochaetia bacterium]